MVTTPTQTRRHQCAGMFVINGCAPFCVIRYGHLAPQRPIVTLVPRLTRVLLILARMTSFTGVLATGSAKAMLGTMTLVVLLQHLVYEDYQRHQMMLCSATQGNEML